MKSRFRSKWQRERAILLFVVGAAALGRRFDGKPNVVPSEMHAAVIKPLHRNSVNPFLCSLLVRGIRVHLRRRRALFSRAKRDRLFSGQAACGSRLSDLTRRSASVWVL